MNKLNIAALSARPARLNPDTFPVLIAACLASLVVLLGSFTLSFGALSEVGGWAGSIARLAWVVPAFIDGAIIGYTIYVMVARARGESALFAWWSLFGWTSVSIIANGVHAWTMGPENLTQRVLGTAIASAAPLASFGATHMLTHLIVHPAAAVRPRPIAAAVKASQVAPVAVTPPARRRRNTITPVVRARVVELLEAGWKYRAIEEETGVSRAEVGRIKARLLANQPRPTTQELELAVS